MRKSIGIIATALTVTGCSFGQAKDVSETAVVEFHQMLDAGRYHEIYAASSDDLRRMATEEEFSQALQRIHDRLGGVRQSTESDWRVDFSNGNDVVQIHYDTQFASGRGDEEFIYQVSGGAAHLAGYHVRSPLLRTGAAEPEGNSTAPPSSAGDKPSEATAPPPPPPAPPEPSGGK
jgi:hypothetical protein